VLVFKTLLLTQHTLDSFLVYQLVNHPRSGRTPFADFEVSGFENAQIPDRQENR